MPVAKRNGVSKGYTKSYKRISHEIEGRNWSLCGPFWFFSMRQYRKKNKKREKKENDLKKKDKRFHIPSKLYL